MSSAGTPVTSSPLASVHGSMEAIVAGKVKNQAGKAVSQPFEDGLMREDGRRIYPIRDGIPVLFIDEGVTL